MWTSATLTNHCAAAVDVLLHDSTLYNNDWHDAHCPSAVLSVIRLIIFVNTHARVNVLCLIDRCVCVRVWLTGSVVEVAVSQYLNLNIVHLLTRCVCVLIYQWLNISDRLSHTVTASVCLSVCHSTQCCYSFCWVTIPSKDRTKHVLSVWQLATVTRRVTLW